MNTNAKLWLIPAALLVAAGIASFVAQVYVFPGGVDPADWRAPAAYVLEHVGENDAVTVQPPWNEDPYPYLTDVGDQVARQDTVLIEDVHERDRIWLLAETDRLEQALARMPFEPAETKAFGAVTVVRMDAPKKPVITYDLLSVLDRAEVSQLKDGKHIERCKNWRKKERQWQCKRHDKWIYVGEERLDLGGEPHRCIWAHPPPEQKTVRIVFPSVPLEETFRIRGGLNLRAARSKRGTVVNYRVRIGDDFEEERTLPAAETSWNAVDIDTSALAGEQRDVIVEVWTESVFDRVFCFNGWVFDE